MPPCRPRKSCLRVSLVLLILTSLTQVAFALPENPLGLFLVYRIKRVDLASGDFIAELVVDNVSLTLPSAWSVVLQFDSHPIMNVVALSDAGWSITMNADKTAVILSPLSTGMTSVQFSATLHE